MHLRVFSPVAHVVHLGCAHLLIGDLTLILDVVMVASLHILLPAAVALEVLAFSPIDLLRSASVFQLPTVTLLHVENNDLVNVVLADGVASLPLRAMIVIRAHVGLALHHYNVVGKVNQGLGGLLGQALPFRYKDHPRRLK
jgi:hypothetical protein